MKLSTATLTIGLLVGLTVTHPASAASAFASVDVQSSSSAGSSGSVFATIQNFGPSQFPYGGVSRGFAETDIGAGTLRASALAVNEDGVFGHAILEDKLTFLAPIGAPANVPFNVHLRYHFDGFYDVLTMQTGELLDGLRIQEAETRINLILFDMANPGNTAGGTVRHTITKIFRYVYPPGVITDVLADDVTTVPAADANTQLDVLEHSDTTLVGDFMVDLSVLPGAQWDVQAELHTGAVSGLGLVSGSNFTNTGSLGLNLPDGYSYTSESGAFLAAAVPFPGTAWLLTAAVGMLLIRLPRRAT